MNKVLTAEKLFIKYNPQDGVIPEWAKKLMIEFAKLHVKACKEEIVLSAEIDGPTHDSEGHRICSIDEQSILNAYPETNIQ